jgi:hypothetical protein
MTKKQRAFTPDPLALAADAKLDAEILATRAANPNLNKHLEGLCGCLPQEGYHFNATGKKNDDADDDLDGDVRCAP